MACEACGGDGGGETFPEGPGPSDGIRWVECRCCQGTGMVRVELLMLTLDDLEALYGQ